MKTSFLGIISITATRHKNLVFKPFWLVQGFFFLLQFVFCLFFVQKSVNRFLKNKTARIFFAAAVKADFVSVQKCDEGSETKSINCILFVLPLMCYDAYQKKRTIHFFSCVIYCCCFYSSCIAKESAYYDFNCYFKSVA